MRILVTDGMDKDSMAKLREAGHEVVEQFYEPEKREVKGAQNHERLVYKRQNRRGHLHHQ